MPAPDTCLLYLLRHGATINNTADPPILQGCKADPPLSGEGLAQAHAAARLLSSRQIGAVYCTPLLRSRQTAEPIAAVHALRVEEVPDLTECDVGLWEGRSWVEIEQSEDDGRRIRNDRLIVIPAEDPVAAAEHGKKTLTPRRKRELEEFFHSASLFEGKDIEVLGWRGPKTAKGLIEAKRAASRKGRKRGGG